MGRVDTRTKLDPLRMKGAHWLRQIIRRRLLEQSYGSLFSLSENLVGGTTEFELEEKIETFLKRKNPALVIIVLRDGESCMWFRLW